MTDSFGIAPNVDGVTFADVLMVRDALDLASEAASPSAADKGEPTVLSGLLEDAMLTLSNWMPLGGVMTAIMVTRARYVDEG